MTALKAALARPAVCLPDATFDGAADAAGVFGGGIGRPRSSPASPESLPADKRPSDGKRTDARAGCPRQTDSAARTQRSRPYAIGAGDDHRYRGAAARYPRSQGRADLALAGARRSGALRLKREHRAGSRHLRRLASGKRA